MKPIDRRNFLKNSGKASLVAAAAGPMIVNSLQAKNSPNETVNVAVMGIRNRGSQHADNYVQIPNVKISVICDADANLLQAEADKIEKAQGSRPRTEVDIRKVLDSKDVDAVSIASQNHWHSLAGIWACQAGKDVYCEKPVSHNISEGRRLVEAARKYDRVVAVGTQNRSNPVVRGAMDYIHSGKLGEVYMVKCTIFNPRNSIGYGKVVPVPDGVNYDLWLGPAPMRPFIDNRFHYNWHWYWDTGSGETGNNGPHYTDFSRWALQKYDLPRKISSHGGYWGWDCDQQTPNTQMSVMEYDDGKIVQLEVRGLYTNTEDEEVMGCFFYGTEGWMKLARGQWSTYFGRDNEPGETMNDDNAPEKYVHDTRGGGGGPHFTNFINAVRAHDRSLLNSEILEGHLSAAMCHLPNIAYRLGRTVEFDSATETFVNDSEANSYLSREYRYPYVVPEKI